MDAITCIKSRRSVRKFKDQAVSREILEDLVLSASYAPSWKNTQTTRYIAIEDAAVRAKLAAECCAEHNASIINGAPVVVATVIVDKRSGFERDGSYSTIREDNWQAFDNGIATQTFCLAATEKGLGTVIMGLYDIDKASKILEVPEGQVLMSLVAVGYPDEEPGVPKRKTVEDLRSYR
ncbi:MAG: nitroreductase family protein [Lachnospiraceae bacterium]|nr:nitroreductase family protein [Lachnospiraceae bacterium]